mgnify:CR=1 FL=1
MKKLYLLKIFIITLAITAFAACSDDKDVRSYSLDVNKSEFKNIDFEGKTLEFEIDSNTNWTITGAEAWMHLSETNGSGDEVISVKVDAYNDTEAEVRTATLTVKSPNVEGEKKITFYQNPKSLFEAIFKVNIIKYNEVEAKGQTIKGFMITSNVPWKIVDAAPWIHLSETEGTGDAKPIITVDACEEIEDSPRTGTFVVESDKTDKKWTVTIVQLRVPPLNVLDEIEDEKFIFIIKSTFKISDDQPFLSIERAKELTEVHLYEISSLKGLEYFTGLTKLTISSSSATSVDLSKLVNLTKLYIDKTKIASLNTSSLINLSLLYVMGNHSLTTLDLSNNKKLETLTCPSNELEATLDLNNNTVLSVLECNDNQIKSLKIDKCPFLQHIDCSDNEISTIDISGNKMLSKFLFSENLVSTIYVWWDGGYSSIPPTLQRHTISDRILLIKK